MRIHYLVSCFFVLHITLVTAQNHPKIFDSLSTIEQYAASVPENPNIAITDWENPDFSSYHKKITPTFFARSLISLGVLHPLWDINSFTELLKLVTREREYAGYRAHFIQKIEQEPGTAFYIFSNLFGAFHSLVRDLRALQKEGIIDESLKIISPNCYLIFNGNIASRSAYALETLTVILRLLYVNKNPVIVIQGSHEIDRHWQHYAIKRELKVRAASLQVERLPLGNLIDRFLNTFPAAFYIVAERTPEDTALVRISNLGFENKQLSSIACGDFFTKPDQEICNINPKEQQSPAVDVTVRALIRGEPLFKPRYMPTQGLLAAGKEEGATTWATMSGPIQSSQELFQFYHDAYVKLTTASSLDNWILTLYGRDIREYSPIEPSLTVNLLSRQELSPLETIEAQLKTVADEKEFTERKIALLDKKITMHKEGKLEETDPINLSAPKAQATKKEKISESVTQLKEGDIPLGKQESIISAATIIDLSGVTKKEGESVETSIKAVFNNFNKQGTLKNRTLELIAFDSKREVGLPHKAVMQALEKYNTGLLLEPLSTWAMEDYFDFITKNQVLVLFPLASGAGPLRNKNLTNMFFMRASGQQEASAITNYVARELGGKKFALFYANNTWGKEALAGAEAVLKKLNITDYIALSSEEATINVTEQVKALKQFNPDSLGMFCIQEVAKELLNQLGTAWLIDKKLFGPQDLSAQSFINYVNRNKLKFFGTSVVPNPEGSLEIAKQYRDATSQLYIPVDNYGFETYIGADFFTHVLTHIDPPITSKKIINFITNIHDLPYKGLTFDFDPEKRQLLHSIWLISDNKDWKELKLKKPTKQISSKNGTRIEIPLGEKEAVLSIVTTLGLSGITKPEAESVRTGIKIIFDKYNKTTPKTALELIAVDYQDKAAVARSEIMRILQNNKTGLLLLPYSTLILESMLDLIEKQQILALFPMASGEIPDKALANICFLRASGKYEGYALTHYTTSEHRDKKMAFVYSNNSFGKTVLKGAEKALKELNLKEYIAIPIEENYIGITEQQVKILKDFDPHCIGIFTIQATAKALLDKLGIEWVKQKILFGSQDLSPQTFRDYIALNKLNFVCSSVVPSPNSSLEIAQQFRRDTANIPISNDLICFEAYIAADFFTHILQQIKEPITSIKIIDYIEQINNYNYKGLTLNFDAKNRRLLNSIWIIDKENEWKEIKKSSLAKSTKSTKNNNAKKLNIGSILDLSRGDAVYGKTIKAVMEFLIDRANSKKAKNKPLIDLTVIDHEYMPEKARKAAETLLNTHHADIILCPVGSSPFASFLDYINKGDLISLFPVTVIPGKGSEIPNAIFLGVSYPEQAQVLVQYCMERLKMQRLAILYQNDEYGKTLLEGAKKALDKHNIKYTPISYERNSTNFSQQIEQIKTINPDTMGLFALSETSIEFLRQLGEPYTKRIRFFGANPISTQVMTDFLIKNEIQCIRTNIVPNYMDQNLQLSREFFQTMKEAHITPDTTAFETYICTEIFLDIVSNLKEPADKQSILQACKGIHNISFKGLMLNYDPEDNRLINDVWIDEGKQTPWIHIPLKKGK